MSLYGEAKFYHEINLLPETYIDRNVRLNNFKGLSSSKLAQKTFGLTISPLFDDDKTHGVILNKLRRGFK